MLIQFGDELVEILIAYRRRKTIKITIKPDLSVEVIAPMRTSKKYLKELVLKKTSWILKHRERMKKSLRIIKEHEYKDGEVFYILGKAYKLRVMKSSQNNVFIFQNDIFICAKKKDDIDYKKRLMEKWYSEMASAKLKNIYDNVCEKFKEIYEHKPKLAFRKMKARWGSYTPIENKVLLNSNLIKVPEKCIEYVIVHELCHIQYLNHKKEFYNFLEHFIPEWKSIREELNRYANV